MNVRSKKVKVMVRVKRSSGRRELCTSNEYVSSCFSFYSIRIFILLVEFRYTLDCQLFSMQVNVALNLQQRRLVMITRLLLGVKDRRHHGYYLRRFREQEPLRVLSR